MAVCQPPDASSSIDLTATRKRSHSSLSQPRLSYRWIDEEIYRTTILSLWPAQSENEADEKLQTSARNLGLLPVPNSSTSPVAAVASSLSEVTIASQNPQGSIQSQSTAPTSCASSDRRPSTSLSNRSSLLVMRQEPPTIVTDMERKRHSGFKSGLRKMTGFRKKKTPVSSQPSFTSLRSHMTTTTTNEPALSPLKSATSIKSGDSYSSQDLPVHKDLVFETQPSIDEEALQRSLENAELARIRDTQIEEKRRFLEYQTRLIKELLNERDQLKAEKKQRYQRIVAEQEEKNEKAVEILEARQLEDELKQEKENEVEKRSIQTRLKHMEAYCHTPSPPQSPSQMTFGFRASEDSLRSLPERHVTQQHYENLAQVYHVRDNMDGLHASKINVLRGKQKRTLQNFMLKKERELEQMERDHNKEMAAVDHNYAIKEAEIRQEFDYRRTKLEARWKLQTLVERTRLERSTGQKFEALPDIVAVEA